MHIQSVRIYRYSLPLRESLTLKGSVYTRRDGLLIEIVSDADHTGWGDIAPLPGFSLETLEEAELQLVRFKSRLQGASLDSAGIAVRSLSDDALAPSVRSGISMALFDLRRRGDAGSSVPGGGDEHIFVNALLQIGDGAAARDLVAQGYRAIKLKVGRTSVQEDLANVHDVLSASGEGVRLRLDANRAWRYEEALAFMRGLGDLPYEYIEEPLQDAASLRQLVEGTGARVALDESLATLTPDDLGQHEYAVAVVLKPTFLGGFFRVGDYVTAAHSLGMEAVVSAAYESGVGIRAMALLASELQLGGTPAGLDTYRWLDTDILEPRLALTGGGFRLADLLDPGRRIRSELFLEVT